MWLARLTTHNDVLYTRKAAMLETLTLFSIFISHVSINKLIDKETFI